MRIVFFTIVAVLGVSQIGCNSGHDGELKGRVTFNNEPVTVGSLSFTTEDGEHTIGVEMDSNGEFEAQHGAPPGPILVTYEPPFAETPDDDGWDKAKKFKKCQVADDAKLIEIKPGPNDVKIELVSGG